MRSIIFILGLALIGLQYKLWCGDSGIMPWFNLEKRVAVAQEENKKLAAQNQAVEANILELKSSAQALEEQARYDLGMVKEGEIYYQFME